MNRVLFITLVMGHGRGGHFHSMNDISREIGKSNPVGILTVGPGHSSVLAENPHFLEHLSFRGRQIFDFNRRVKEIIKEFNASIIHIFEDKAFSLISPVVSRMKLKLIMNKCGGSNPRYKYPYVENIVLFSYENHLWFKNYSLYKDAYISLIPNRTNRISLDEAYQPIKKGSEFTLVRIARIGSYYKKSIYDSIRLVDDLVSKYGLKMKLLVIGTIQEQAVFNDLKSHIVDKSYVEIITDDEYTQNASRMLYLADAVIGTGRGIMEAASLKLPLLVIDKQGNIPVLLDNETFDDAFKTNFSERNIFSNKVDNLDKIIQMIVKPEYYNNVSGFSGYIFDEYFDVQKSQSKYQNVYEMAKFIQKRGIRKKLINMINYLRVLKNIRAIS